MDGVWPDVESKGGGLDPLFGIRMGGVPPLEGVGIGGWLFEGLDGEEDEVDGNGPKVVGGDIVWGVAGGLGDVFSADPVDPLLFWDFCDEPCSPLLRPK